jgi:hypothetical protein
MDLKLRTQAIYLRVVNNSSCNEIVSQFSESYPSNMPYYGFNHSEQATKVWFKVPFLAMLTQTMFSISR